ncbi:zf-HC2 domain-containing protein [Streptomyces sp. BI20]|uniref:zf-HC2 domain-containing protein n=1 Tax=Streptomyces sp. BI20 TaxID=3403460 RepID=UPI003C71C83C
MTSTTGTIGHPDVSEISDLAEGLLPPARTTEIREHLAGCALCADVRDSLDEIRALLGTLPGPPRMPADIAGRIDAALAAEALLDATAPRPAAERVSRETRSGEGPRAPRPTTAPRAPEVAAGGPGRTRRRRTARLALFGTAAAGLVGVVLWGALGSNPGSGTAPQAVRQDRAAAEAAAGFSAESLPDTVRNLLTAAPEALVPQKRTAPDQGAAGIDSTPSAAAGQGGTDTGAPGCVLAGAGRTDPPVAAESGSWAGRRAWLVVFAHPGDSARVDAWVIDSRCADRPDTGPAPVLHRATLPRP